MDDTTVKISSGETFPTSLLAVLSSLTRVSLNYAKVTAPFPALFSSLASLMFLHCKRLGSASGLAQLSTKHV